MAEFDLAKLMKQASESNDRERIEYINIQDIQADPHNFYSTDGIDELAANIEMVGLQQPIRVRKVRIAHSLPEGGYEPFHDVYRVVSGHRRLAAWKKLDLNCPGETYRKIAAIVEPERREPEALQELRLIFANSDTRRMTGPDLQQQARRIRELLKILKNDGYEFKGRMRDQVAQICGVSKSKLSRLDAIENNLHAGIKGAYYNTGKISETLAYEISRLPKEDQSEVCPDDKPLIKAEFESDEDLSLSSSESSNKKMKDYTVELYGRLSGSMKNCTKDRGFDFSTKFDMTNMSIVSDGEELASIKQTLWTHIAETEKEDGEYEQGLYLDFEKAAMSRMILGQLLGIDDGLYEKDFIDISDVYPDQFVMSDILKSALPIFMDAIKEGYKDGKVELRRVEKKHKSFTYDVYRVLVSITDKEDYASFLKDIAKDALEDSLVSSVASDLISSYIDDAFEDIETVDGSFYIDLDYEYLDGFSFDFNVTMKEKETTSSESEETSNFILKSLSFSGEGSGDYGENASDLSYDGSLLDHDVWKEIEL